MEVGHRAMSQLSTSVLLSPTHRDSITDGLLFVNINNIEEREHHVLETHRAAKESGRHTNNKH